MKRTMSASSLRGTVASSRMVVGDTRASAEKATRQLPSREKAEDWNKWDSMALSQNTWLQRSKNWFDKRLFKNPETSCSERDDERLSIFNQCVLYPHELRTERLQEQPRTTRYYESRTTIQLRHRPC